MGPGLKEVGPFGTTISSGAVSPGFATILVFVFSSSLKSLKGFSFVKIRALWPVACSFKAATLPPRSLNACSISVLRAIFTLAVPRRFRLICWTCEAGMPYMSTTPTSVCSSMLRLISATSSFFHRGRFCV